MSKIIFVDVDGTLVDYSNQLPSSAVTAICEARKNGHRVYACTGRSKAEMYQNILDIGLDGMIGGNGSYVEDHDHVVMHQVISEEESREIVDWLHEKGLEFYLESNNGLFASEHFEEAALESLHTYAKGKGVPNADTLSVREGFPEMIWDGELYRNDLNKVSFLLNSYQDYLDAKEKFSDLSVNTWGGKGEEALFGDIGVANITKAHAIHCLLEYLGADIKETIAFGDAKIDIPMFECCAESCCMGSGGEEAKEAADFVTTDVDKDGLYNGFKHFNLI